jgi:hypothetical protein
MPQFNKCKILRIQEKEVRTYEKFCIPGYAQPGKRRPYGPISSSHILQKGIKATIHAQV